MADLEANHQAQQVATQRTRTAEHRAIRNRWVTYVFGLTTITVSLCLSALLAVSIVYQWPTSPSNLILAAVITLVACAIAVAYAKYSKVCPRPEEGVATTGVER